MDNVNTRHSSTTHPHHAFVLQFTRQTQKACVFDQVIHRPIVTCLLSCEEGGQLLLFLGKKLWHILEVMISEGARGRGLVIVKLCATLPCIYNSCVWYAIRRLFCSEKNNSSFLWFSYHFFGSYNSVPPSDCRQNPLLSNVIGCCNSERVGNDNLINGLATQYAIRVVPPHCQHQIALNASCQHLQRLASCDHLPVGHGFVDLQLWIYPFIQLCGYPLAFWASYFHTVAGTDWFC